MLVNLATVFFIFFLNLTSAQQVVNTSGTSLSLDSSYTHEMSAAAVTAAASVSSRKGKALLIPHGGGPMPLLNDPEHREMIKWLKTFPTSLPKFSSIVVVSAHWEEKVPTITSGASPSLIYDYYGFPEETYNIKYPAPGNPALAARISKLLSDADISNKQDEKRGFDHGMFVPLLLMYPEANIPVVQLSLSSSLDADLHIRIGKAIAPLLNEDILILGSGFTFHNMRYFYTAQTERKGPNEAFEAWLKDTCTSNKLSEAERTELLVNWAKAPGARFCHPREEHLLPLHVCYGAGGSAGVQVFDDLVMAKTSGYLW